MINLSRPTSGFSFVKLASTKSIPEWPQKPKFLFSNPIPSSSANFLSNIRLFHHCWASDTAPRNGFQSNRDLRPSAVAGLSLGSLEGPQSVLEAVAVLAAIIIVHESGHFLAAYLQGIHVSKFAVGFGPVLAKFNAKNVEFSIRAFPLGGFVGFPDNDPESDIPVDDENLLTNRPIIDRVVSVGLPVQEAFPGVLVPDVRLNSAAARDGLRSGDIILSVNGNSLSKSNSSVFEVVDVIKKSPGTSVALKVERKNEILEIGVTPDLNSDGTGRVGVQLSANSRVSRLKPSNLAQATVYASREFWGLSMNVLDSLKQTFFNFSQSASKVSGPVAIIAVGAEVARSSTDGIYQFAAILNLNLAVINLLPLPALDGGSLALLLAEAVRGGRKIPQEVEQRIMSSGIMIVVLLGVFLLVRDTLNLSFIREML
ncbi:hypothetical protein AMTR_s00037p00192870 [Amborella trichopoda]|uniref:PDZ domain-containing protein n=1 Tax=Amborella trichopoda TaxID=13333 RepID=U5D575_AMBTC|nr:hypothetical protein AMTR_s00037p00192870 [Amborella trichopoda]